MKKSRTKVNHDAKSMDYNVYMALAHKIKSQLKYGDMTEFMDQYGDRFSRASVDNALQGYYMREGMQILYKRFDILNALADFISKKRKAELRQQTNIVNVVNTL